MAEVTFGETSSGAAMVQGSYVGQGQSELISFVQDHFCLNSPLMLQRGLA